jgi:hypothetical protein
VDFTSLEQRRDVAPALTLAPGPVDCEKGDDRRQRRRAQDDDGEGAQEMNEKTTG